MSDPTFGQLTVVRKAPSKSGHTYVAVRCACGVEFDTRLSALHAGKTTRCSSCARSALPTLPILPTLAPAQTHALSALSEHVQDIVQRLNVTDAKTAFEITALGTEIDEVNERFESYAAKVGVVFAEMQELKLLLSETLREPASTIPTQEAAVSKVKNHSMSAPQPPVHKERVPDPLPKMSLDAAREMLYDLASLPVSERLPEDAPKVQHLVGVLLTARQIAEHPGNLGEDPRNAEKVEALNNEIKAGQEAQKSWPRQ